MENTAQKAVRDARHAGFVNSLSNSTSKESKNNIYDRYKAQDARREKNISGFVAQIRGGK